MKTCKDCQYFDKKTFSYCKKQHLCLAHHPACNDFKEIQTEINLNYLYIGLLRKCELGLVEIEQNKETNYRRIEMGPGDWVLNNGNIFNATKIEFPIATKIWGRIDHFGIFDSLQKGNFLVAGTLNRKANIFKDQIVHFEICNMQIALDAIGIFK